MPAIKCKERDALLHELGASVDELVTEEIRMARTAGMRNPEAFVSESRRLEELRNRHRRAIQAVLEHCDRHECKAGG